LYETELFRTGPGITKYPLETLNKLTQSKYIRTSSRLIVDFLTMYSESQFKLDNSTGQKLSDAQ